MDLNTLKSFYKEDFNIFLYESKTGNKPVLEYIHELNPKAQLKIIYLIELLATYGNNLREPFSKHLKENLFELRAKTNNKAERIIYCFIDGKNCILLHGFTKETQKTPKKELDIALERYDDLIERIKGK